MSANQLPQVTVVQSNSASRALSGERPGSPIPIRFPIPTGNAFASYCGKDTHCGCRDQLSELAERQGERCQGEAGPVPLVPNQAVATRPACCQLCDLVRMTLRTSNTLLRLPTRSPCPGGRRATGNGQWRFGIRVQPPWHHNGPVRVTGHVRPGPLFTTVTGCGIPTRESGCG